MYIVSACLLGANCKYNGGNNRNDAVIDFCEGHKVLTVCPETEGGLESPRPPAEQTGGRIVNREGKDVTEPFLKGADKCLMIVLDAVKDSEAEGETGEPELAILKANSPSCGSGRIYDGTFTGTLTEGDGCFARLLKERGIRVVSEEDIENISDGDKKE